MVDNPKNCVYTPPVATLQGERQTKSRAVAQSGSALAWGARGRGFESRLPDEIKGSAKVITAAEPFCFVIQMRDSNTRPRSKGGFGFACFTGYAETGWAAKTADG